MDPHVHNARIPKDFNCQPSMNISYRMDKILNFGCGEVLAIRTSLMRSANKIFGDLSKSA
jgi:hypothetical protein